MDSDTSMDSFDNFSYKLVSTLRSLLQTVKCYKTLHNKQERLWHEFHKARSHSLITIWQEYCKSTGIQYDQLAAQTVNMKLFETFMKSFFVSIPNNEDSASPVTPATYQFSDDKLNALRYVSGCMPYKLLTKYEQCRTPCHAYLEYLGNMAVVLQL